MSYRLEPMEPTEFLLPDPSTNPTKPCEIYFYFDPPNNTIWIETVYSIDGIPEEVWNNRVLRWPVPPTTDASLLVREINEGKIDDWLKTIRDEFEVVWNGNNHVGTKTPAARDAEEAIARWLNEFEGTLEGGLAEASDWLYPIEVDLRERIVAGEDLDVIAEELEAEAKEQRVVLVGTKRYLEYLKERLEEEEEENA